MLAETCVSFLFSAHSDNAAIWGMKILGVTLGFRFRQITEISEAVPVKANYDEHYHCSEGQAPKRLLTDFLCSKAYVQIFQVKVTPASTIAEVRTPNLPGNFIPRCSGCSPLMGMGI
ncbi:hypothetical protein AVEN_221474-1 [Araneus ventricosus]|uniref:Uncharacterized protein n=1 Tax=Araneus ventricosus TaxID=182803 RepID=A0A4Y2NU01_ARAVE|nr:hypothetical protein AVEN_221472-1 [Araneus ventricosus]GBN41852.1 hypothetical protein AVEN_221474-1 [Araneus ventricosus]